MNKEDITKQRERDKKQNPEVCLKDRDDRGLLCKYTGFFLYLQIKSR